VSEELHLDQSAVIPYRKKDNAIEILLITSIRKKRWIVPKGFIEFNLSAFESAKKEAYEEAGIIGANETIELGTITLNRYGGEVLVRVYSMEVIEEINTYPEKHLRKRKWFSVEEALEKINVPEMVSLIKKLDGSIKFN
jgi:phosphohistidine phosphatase